MPLPDGTVRVGVVADTHVGEYLPVLPAGVLEALAGVDLVVHAGDLSIPAVLDDLRAVAPVAAVRGNHDEEGGLDLPRDLVVRVGGVRIGVTHGTRPALVELASVLFTALVGRPVLLALPWAVARRFRRVDCVVFGHLHQPVHVRRGRTLVFSPGAVFVAEADSRWQPVGLRGRLYRLYRRGAPAAARTARVGILEIRGGRVTARSVPVPGPMR